MGDPADLALLALVATWDFAVDAVAAVMVNWLGEPVHALADEIDARLTASSTGSPGPADEPERGPR
jgi:hypothetical protein